MDRYIIPVTNLSLSEILQGFHPLTHTFDIGLEVFNGDVLLVLRDRNIQDSGHV